MRFLTFSIASMGFISEEDLTHRPHTALSRLILQEVIAARAAGHEVDGRIDTLIRQTTVELELHITRPLELFEDHIIHLRARLLQGRSEDRQATATADVTRSTEEALGLLQGVGIDTTGEHLTRGRLYRM